MPASVTYSNGEWLALTSESTWMLAEVTADSPLVTTIWSLVSSGAAPEELVDALLSEGVRAMPSFALLTMQQDESRIVVRGRGLVRVQDGAGDQDYRPPEGAAWGDFPLRAPIIEALVTWSDNAGAGIELPMLAGVLQAGRIRVTVSTEIPRQPSAPRRSTRASAAVAARPAPTAKPPEPAPAEPVPVLRIVAPVPEPEPMVPAVPVMEMEEENEDYDDLFAATGLRSELDVVTEIDLEPVDALNLQIEPGPDEALPSSSNESTSAITEWSESEENDGGGLIDHMPWDEPQARPPAKATRKPTRPVQAPAAAKPNDQHVRTVSRAQLQAEVAAATGHVLLAARCPTGHMTSTASARCRVCDAVVAEQPPIEVTRPSLGLLRLPSDDTVILDRGVVFGRAPEAQESDDGERPNLVKLASPDNELSRSHAQIVLDGWTVYVIDLGSTNGTAVTLPGQERVRLRAHEHYAVEPESVITLADVYHITFEVHP